MLAQTFAQQTARSKTMVQELTPPTPPEGGEILGAFRRHLVGMGKSGNTVSAYCQDVGVFASWVGERYGEGFDLAMFNRSDLQVFFQVQTGELKVSPATWNRRRASLRVFAAWAHGQGLISYDPTDGLQGVEEVALAPRWIDGREYGRVLRALELAIQGARSDAWRVKALRDRAIVLLMAEGGLREGEVSGLDLGDVTLGERKGKVAVRYGKGKKSRAVPVGKVVVDALKAYLNLPNPSPSLKGREQRAVFVGKGGVRLEGRGIQRLVAELGRQAGVADLTPHRLRHYFVKSRLDAGASIIEVAKLSGHSRVETLARYGQPSEADLERVQGIR